jgi:hypothetical protein
MDWRYDLSGRVPALQLQGPQFNPGPTKKTKQQTNIK